jgi:hypothetical protein
METLRKKNESINGILTLNYLSREVVKFMEVDDILNMTSSKKGWIFLREKFLKRLYTSSMELNNWLIASSTQRYNSSIYVNAFTCFPILRRYRILDDDKLKQWDGRRSTIARQLQSDRNTTKNNKIIVEYKTCNCYSIIGKHRWCSYTRKGMMLHNSLAMRDTDTVMKYITLMREEGENRCCDIELPKEDETPSKQFVKHAMDVMQDYGCFQMKMVRHIYGEDLITSKFLELSRRFDICGFSKVKGVHCCKPAAFIEKRKHLDMRCDVCEYIKK